MDAELRVEELEVCLIRLLLLVEQSGFVTKSELLEVVRAA